LGSVTDWIQIALLLVTVYVAWCQVSSVRSEARKTRTLDVCNRYDCDTVLAEALNELHKAKKERVIGKDADPNIPGGKIYELRQPVVTLLNYLDSLAIGIEQEVYDPDMIEDHMKSIILTHCHEWLRADMLERLDLKATDFLHLGRLQKRYENPETKAKKGRWQLFWSN
jgi:hypothetical protein